MATKGFSAAVHSLHEGVDIAFYNLHLDAGADENRAKQTAQLLTHIAARDDNVPVIAGGDWNLTGLQNILENHHSTMRTVSGVLGESEQIDHIVYKSGQFVSLYPIKFKVLKDEFTDQTWGRLSDHDPVLAFFFWLEPSPSMIVYEPEVLDVKPLAPRVNLLTDTNRQTWLLVREEES